MHWTPKHPQAHPDMLGFLPDFLDSRDLRPAAEQINDNYRHGGGWRPQSGFRLKGETFQYPGDPPLTLLFETKLRHETIRFYDYAWLAIIQPNGEFEISRID